MLNRTLLTGALLTILCGFIFAAPPTTHAAGNEEVVFVCASANTGGTVGTVTPGKKKSWFNFFSKNEPTTITIDCSKGSTLPPTASSSGATVPAPPKKEGFLERLARWFRPPPAANTATNTTESPEETIPPEKNNKTQEEINNSIEYDVIDIQNKTEILKTDIADLEAQKRFSKFKNKLFINVNHNENPDYEYVTIITNGDLLTEKEKILISGLVLKSQRGFTVRIPGASSLPQPGRQHFDEAVSLGLNESAFIITGISPNGLSFRPNKCTGGFSYTQTFAPGLSYRCPNPTEESWSLLLTPECRDYIVGISSCVVPENLPIDLDAECQTAIGSHISYNGCVETHRNDTDFYDKDWRIYLKRSARLWRDVHETIQLLDTEGKVIDEVIYP